MNRPAIDLRTQAEGITEKYPQGRSRSALLPLLALVQQRDGYVTPQGINEIADILGLSSAEVRGVASFYHMLKLKPTGRRIVSVCHTIACAIGGADRVIAALESELGIVCGETTPDGSITLERTECLAACDLAPMMQVDYDQVHGPLTDESALQIVSTLRNGTYVPKDQPASSGTGPAFEGSPRRGEHQPPPPQRLADLPARKYPDEETDGRPSIKPRGAE